MAIKLKSKIIFILITSLVVSSTLPGCVNRREIDKLGLLGAIGVDWKEDKIILTMEVNKPIAIGGGAGVEKEPFIIVQTSGDSFFDAIRNATNKFDRKMFLATARIFIISEQAAREGAVDFLEFWWRDHDARTLPDLVVTKDGDASELMGVSGGVSGVPSLYLKDLIAANMASSKSVRKTIFQFLKEYHSQGLQPTVGVMRLNSKGEKEGKEEFEILFEGSAVFLQDKLVGYLDGLETRSLNFVTNKVKSAIIVTPTAENEKASSIEIMKSTSTLDVILEDDRTLVKVKLKIDGMLGEQLADIDSRQPHVMKAIEESCSRTVTEQVRHVIQKVQKEYRSDIFGFGNVVHRKYPEVWKKTKGDWNNIFADAELMIEVETNISRSGLFHLPIKSKIGK